MSTYNNSLRFYKGYYKGIDWSKKSDDPDNARLFANRNKELADSTLPDREDELPFSYSIPEGHCFDLETTYPGLLLGSGITHGSGLLGEIKLGFYLDHTTGLPVIPGSSVKGVLRSVWPLGFKHAATKEKDDAQRKKLLAEKAAWVAEYLQTKLKIIGPGQDWDSNAIEALEAWLFGNYEAGAKVGPMPGRTIFHDALPVSAARVRIKGAYTDQYLASDFITPHKHPLRNPVPIQFLKVLPGVVFRFQFNLMPYKNDKHQLSVEAIRLLFKSILRDIGIGAKTNVGYGQFIEPQPKPPPEQRQAANRSLGSLLPDTGYSKGHEGEKPILPIYSLYPSAGDTIELHGIIKEPKKENQPNRVTFLTEPKNLIQGYKHKKLDSFSPGDIVKMKIRLHPQKSNVVEEILNVEPYKP